MFFFSFFIFTGYLALYSSFISFNYISIIFGHLFYSYGSHLVFAHIPSHLLCVSTDKKALHVHLRLIPIVLIPS